MINKKCKIFLIASTFCFMNQSLFSKPPSELHEADLESIKARNGIYIRNNKHYATWAYKPNEEKRLGVLAKDTLEGISSLEGWKAIKLSYESEAQTTCVKVEETPQGYTSVAHNLETYRNIIQAASTPISSTPLPVSCNLEAVNPLLNPDINDLLEENSMRAVPMSKSTISKIWSYRLYNGNGEPVKDFLLLRVGKGVDYTQLKEEAKYALEFASLE